MITQLELFNKLDYNPYTGMFIWITGKNIYNIAGSEYNNGYIIIKINGERYSVHRLAWLYMTGKWPKNEIDHINLNKSDNRFCNLREATKSQNSANVLKRNNISKIKGVCWHKKANKWMVQIKVENKNIYLGLFDNIENAAKIYKIAAIKYFGEYARP